MAKSEGEIVAISDAGPIIHLDELASLYLNLARSSKKRSENVWVTPL